MFRKLIFKSNPKSYISEAYRILRSNVEFVYPKKKFKTMLIASPVPQEGMDIFAANFALSIAESRKRVILVDCDLRKPVLHKIFDVDGKPGLTNILLVDEKLSDVIQNVEGNHSTLFFIKGGPIPPNPSKLLYSEKMRSLVEELKSYADIIILYAPPIMGFSDSLDLANQVDGVLLFINSGKVSYDAAKQAKELLKKAKANILGVVLNDINIKQENYFKYYHQHNYQGYFRFNNFIKNKNDY